MNYTEIVRDKESALKKAKYIHGDKYRYDRFIYNGTKNKVIITCKIHGDFEQKLASHLEGKGCIKCAKELVKKKLRLTTKEFIEKAKKVHGDKYDYSNVDYKNSSTKVRIVCKEHGEFLQKPNGHLTGFGCPKCGLIKSAEKTKGKNKLSNEEFLKRVKENCQNPNMDFTNTKYNGMNSYTHYVCKIHGEKSILGKHLANGVECPDCSIDKQTQNKYDTLETFMEKVNKIHNNLDFSKVEYKGSYVPIKLKCTVHDYEFEGIPKYIIGSKQGCPKCSSIRSRGEKEIEEFLKENGIHLKVSRRKIIHPYELDIVDTKRKIAIEFNGLYWHTEDRVGKDYHINKTEMCKEAGYKLIHIFEDEWNYKKDIVKSRLLNIFNLTSNKIYGRKTEIKEVESKEAIKFLEENHIQGKVNSKIKIGLYFENELVSLMTFGSLRKALGNSSKEGCYELLRFCNKKGTTVMGGASKLLKHFEDKYRPKELISYADYRWSEGELYKKLDMKFAYLTKPNYFYIPQGSKVRENRFKYRKSELLKEGYSEDLTERQIMIKKGYQRIYDCGSLKYKKIYNK